MRNSVLGCVGLVIVLGAALLLGSVGPAMAEAVQWSGNGHYYEVISAPAGISWDDANTAATNAGEYLATLTSQAEADFVYSLVDNSTYWTFFHNSWEGPWLGGYQAPPTTTPTANWNWVTGEPWVYTNWASGQPNDNGGSEDKLNYIGSGGARSSGWNDILSIDPLGKPIAYVIESPEPSTFVLLGIGAASLLAYGWWKRRKSA